MNNKKLFGIGNRHRIEPFLRETDGASVPSRMDKRETVDFLKRIYQPFPFPVQSSLKSYGSALFAT